MSSRSSQEKVSFTVLENGLDFIETALDYAGGDPNPASLKYAVLHLSAGLELLLKDRLQREHWSLVFENLDSASRESYEEGDFRSVGLKECIKRLDGICSVEISERDQTAIRSLKKKRNRLEHFATVDSSMAFKASTARVLSFTLDFIADEYEGARLTSKEEGLLDTIRAALPSFQKLVDERMQSIQPQLDKLEDSGCVVVECPRCTIRSAYLEGGLECVFCGFTSPGNAAASEYVRTFFGLDWRFEADGGQIPIYSCPECGAEALVDLGHLKSELLENQLVCFECGQLWDWEQTDFCVRCGRLFLPIDGIIVCPDCFQSALNNSP